jgi:hypothetical protein
VLNIIFIENFKEDTMKNRIKILFVVMFSLTTFLVEAQSQNASSVRSDAKVNWAKPLEEPSNTDIQKIIATEAYGIYALRLKQSGSFSNPNNIKAIVEYYDASMKLVRQKELSLDFKGKNRSFKDVVMLQGKLWLLSYFYNEKHEKTYLFAQRIDNQTLTLDKELIKISEQDDTNKERQDVFSHAISRDSSKIVIFTQQTGDKKQEEFTLAVFDSDFNDVWSKKAKLPYNRKSFDVEETQVDKNGNVYLLGVIYTEGSNRTARRGKANFQYDLVAYMRDSTLDVQEYKINLKDKFITDLTFRVADDADLVFSGFYSEKGVSSMKGTCFFKINPRSKDMTSVSTREFDFNFLTENLSQRNKEKAKAASLSNDKTKEVELPAFNLDKLILRSDGGALLVAEQYFIEEQYQNNRYNPYGYSTWGGGWYDPYYDPWSYRNNLNRQRDIYYNYNDIIVVNIRPDGEIAWSARIPKSQMTRNDGGIYSSYAMSTVADKLYFIYNEDSRNLDPNRKKIYSESPDKTSVVVLAEVNREGQVKRAPLFQNKEEGIVTRPKICRQISRKEMAIYGESGRTYRFGSLTFE